MHKGKLNKSPCGRWEIVDNGGGRVQVTSGDVIEVVVGNIDFGGAWISTRIEHGGQDYYAVAQGVKLYSGQPARIEGY